MAQHIKIMALSMVALAAVAGSASAQVDTRTTDDCEAVVYTYDGSDGTKEGQFPDYPVFAGCSAADMARTVNIYVPQAVQRAIGNSFGFGPALPQPAGLSDVIADDRLSDSEIEIAPAAATTTATKWNGWSDGRYLRSDYAPSAGDLDGPTLSAMGGLDYKLTDRITLGVMVALDRTRLDSAVNNVDSDTIGAGPYLGVLLTDNIVLSANVMGSHIDSAQAGGVLRFDTERIQAATGVTGYWFFDTVRVTPAVTLSWSKDWEKETSAFGLPDRTIEVGLLTPSLQVGNTMRLNDTTTVEPWIGAALDWTFLSRVDVSGSGSTDDPSTDLRLQAGLNFNFGTNAQLAITGEASGLLLDDLDAYSIAANFAVQF